MSAIRSQVRNSAYDPAFAPSDASRRLKALQWAVALALGTSVCGSAYAMRVGHSRVVSVPGAPLQAVVGLQELTPDEIASLRVSVADEAAWLRAGLKPPVPLADLVVGVENGMDATRKNLRVRSSQAPASGAVDLLLDISSSAGQRQVQVSILAARRGRRRHAGLGGRQGARAPAPAAPRSMSPGDTLYAIAQRNAVPGASIYQMLVALWRANPQAFIQSNMNLLKAGQKLSIPDADAVRDRSGRGAPDLQRACRSLRQYRSRLGAAAGANPTVVKGRAQRPALSVVPAIQAPLPPRPPRTACACPTDRTAARRKPTPRAMPRRPPDTRWPMRRRVTTLQGNVDALNKAVGEQGAAGQAGATGAGGVAGSAVRRRCGASGSAGAGSTGPLGRLDLAVRQARPVPRDPPPRGGAGAAGSTGATGAAGAAGSTGATGAAGSAGTTARQAPRVPVPLRERRASVRRLPSARFGCGPGRRFRRFGTRRQERCGPEAVRSAGRRAVLADRQSAGDRHRRAGAARLHHRLGAAPARAVAMTTRKPTLTPSRRWTRPR